MKNKILSIFLVAALLIPLLAFPAFAADLTNEDVVDAQGGFFRDIGNMIANGFNKSIENVKNGISQIADGIGKIINVIVSTAKDAVKAIGGFFASLARVIGESVAYLLDGIKKLFIPRSDYFPSVQERLQTALNKKLGGVLSVTEYFKTRFAGLRSNPDAIEMFTVIFPNGHMFSGWRIKLISRILPAVPLFRDVFSALMVIATVLLSSCKRND